MAHFYGWSSTASRLEPLRGGSLVFTTLSSQKFLVLILSTSEGWTAKSTLEPPSCFEHGTPGLESSPLTTRLLLLILTINKVLTFLCLLCLCANGKYSISFQNKLVSSHFKWVPKYILFLVKMNGEGRPF